MCKGIGVLTVKKVRCHCNQFLMESVAAYHFRRGQRCKVETKKKTNIKKTAKLQLKKSALVISDILDDQECMGAYIIKDWKH